MAKYLMNIKLYVAVLSSSVPVGRIAEGGHWIMEENPQATMKLVMEFLAK
jgi:pimeloyl-ACP methyl ester carboxylesterase